MFIQKGKTNWILIIVVALIAGAAGGASTLYINDTVWQANHLVQTVGVGETDKKQDVPACEENGQNVVPSSSEILIDPSAEANN